MATEAVVERFSYSSYEEVVRQTALQCRELQLHGGWISSVQIDTYLPHGRKGLKDILPASRSEDHWAVRVATAALQAAEQLTRETSVVTIWYHASHAKQRPLEYKLHVYHVFSHELIAKDVARELDAIRSSHGTLLAVNYDTYGSHRSEHSDSTEITAVTIFYSEGDHHPSTHQAPVAAHSYPAETKKATSRRDRRIARRRRKSFAARMSAGPSASAPARSSALSSSSLDD